MRLVTFKLSEEELDYLNRLSLLLGVSRSELIRRALRQYMYQLRHDRGKVDDIRFKSYRLI